ncbi:MFS transporter [Pannonibacter phragmitetus]|uniref:MFS transporter n=2 Tax=Pannonibacter phragmitetus TaxID=121719 RepID=UPI0013C3F513|nr:MFS transporter [Pannonibacter phragmitetus]
MAKLRMLMLALAANAFHQAALIALVPVLQHLFGVSLATLGALVGLGLLAAALAIPGWGRVAASHGLDRALQLTLTGAGLGAMMMGAGIAAAAYGWLAALPAFALLAAGRLIYSLSAPAILPLAQSAGTVRKPQNTGTEGAALAGHIGRLNAMNGIGRLAGNALIAPLLLLGAWAPVLLPLPVYLAALVLFLRKDSGEKPAVRPVPKMEAGAARPGWRPLAGPLSLGFLLQLSTGAAYVLLGPVIAQRLSLSPSEAASAAGLCLAVSVAVGIAVQLGLERIIGHRLQAGRLAGAVLCAAGLGLLTFAASLPVLALAAALTAAGLSVALGANTALTLSAEGMPASGRALASTRLSSLQFAGLAAGSLAGGVLGSISLDMALAVLAGATALTAILIPILTRFSRSSGPALQLPLPDLSAAAPAHAPHKGASE